MKCPQCGATLTTSKRHGVILGVCNGCGGMWLTRQELDELENEAYDLGKKGSLIFNPEPSDRACPECGEAMQRFQYRDYDLEMEFCPDGHGFWLVAGEDQRVLELMRQEEKSLKRTFKAEDHWSGHLKHWRSPGFIDRIRDLLR